MQTNRFQQKSPQSGKRFTRVPAWISNSVCLKDITKTELKVLLYICARMGNQTDRACITRSEISAKTGVNSGSISGITRNLMQRGIITIDREGRINSYLVLFTPPNIPSSTDIVPHDRNWGGTGMHPIPAQDYSTYSDSGLYEETIKQPAEEDTKLPPY